MICFNIKILIKEFIKLIQFWQFNVLAHVGFSVFPMLPKGSNLQE